MTNLNNKPWFTEDVVMKALEIVRRNKKNELKRENLIGKRVRSKDHLKEGVICKSIHGYSVIGRVTVGETEGRWQTLGMDLESLLEGWTIIDD